MIEKMDIHKNKLTGILWIVLSMIFFSITMSISKFLGSEVHTLVKIFMRLLFGLILLLPFMFDKTTKLKTNNIGLYLLRTSCVCAAMFCTYFTYTHLPLALATSIGFTTPIFTILLSILFLKEKVSLSHWILIIIGYIGVLIITRPTLSFHFSYITIGLLANFLASCAIIMANKISRTDSAKQILFLTTLLSVLFTSIPTYYFWQRPNAQEFFLLFLLGCTGMLSQYCYLKAIRLEKISFLSSFEYIRLIFMVPIGVFVFNEIPNPHIYLGSIIIIASNLCLTYLKAKDKG